MKNKTTIFLLLLALSLMLVSCRGGSGKNNTEVKLLTGTKGLTMEFLKKGRSTEVYERGTLFATVELNNEGYSDISQGILIASYEQDLLELTSWELPDGFSTNKNGVMFDLKGKSLANTRGEKQVLSSVFTAREIDDTLNKVESQIALHGCYAYKTFFSETICIDTDPNNLRIAEKSCQAKDISASSQGAPIAITKVEQKIVPGSSPDTLRLQFTIKADKKSDGILINPNRYREICSGDKPSEQDYNVLWLQSLRFSDYEYRGTSNSGNVECIPNPLKETKNSYYTSCTIKENQGIPKDMATFETPLIIELVYGFKTSKSLKIDILNRQQDFS